MYLSIHPVQLLFFALASRTLASPSQNVFQPNPHTQQPVLDEDFDSWMAQLQLEWGVKGLAVSVVRRVDESVSTDGWSVETKGYGTRDEDENPVTPDTIFSICSNSKLFTSLALGQLIYDPPPSINISNQITWDTPIASILHDWKLQDPIASKESTIIDILSHRTGLPGHDFAYKRTEETTRDIVGKLRWLKPSVGFRTRFQYNNYMYMVASEIIERLSGIKYTEYIERFILQRLPFTGSTYNGTYAKETGNMADGFGLTDWGAGAKDGEGWWNAVHQPLPLFFEGDVQDLIAGVGGLLMNAKDVAVWLQTLLLDGRHPVTNEQIIPKEAIRQTTLPIIPAGAKAQWPELSIANYGHGQAMYSYRGHNIVEHTGGFNGWKSVISRSPDDGVGISVLTNYDLGAIAMEIVLYQIYDRIFALEKIDWEARFKNLITPTVPSSSPLGPASNTSERLDFTGYVGTYTHPTYGCLELCDPFPGTFENHSSHCSEALSQFAKVIESNYARTNKISPDLIATHTNPLYNYLHLTYIPGSDGLNFTLSFFEVTHTPKNESQVVILPGALSGAEFTAEFAIDKDATKGKHNERPRGLAWGGGSWISGIVGPATGDGFWDRAEVFFERAHGEGCTGSPDF